MYQVAIIGAGPLGIECAIALKLAGISYIQFDKGQAAQAIYNFPPDTRFFSSNERISIAGFPIQTVDQQKCSREEYLAYIRSLVMHYQLKIHSYEEVLSVKKEKDSFELTSQTGSGKKSYQVQYLILASGGTSHPRLLQVPGEEFANVSVRMEDPHKYFQKRVVVIGGKNSAVESALRCFQAGAYVTLIIRKNELELHDVKYWLLPEIQGRLERKEIAVIYGAEVVEFLSDEILIRNGPSDTINRIPYDFVIKAIGFEADMSLFRQLGIDLSADQNAPAYDENTMQTNVKGVFVLGTAVGGTQSKFKVFIENTHVHVAKVVQFLCRELGSEQPIAFLYPPQKTRLEE